MVCTFSARKIVDLSNLEVSVRPTGCKKDKLMPKHVFPGKSNVNLRVNG